MTPRCAEIDELLAAYALDALEETDRLAVIEHLAECRHHDEALADFRSVTAALAGDVAPVEPPARLRSAVLDAFAGETAGPASQPTPIAAASPARRSVLPAAGFAYAIAAALLVVALGLGAWGLSRGGDDTTVLTAHSESGPDHSMRVVYTPDENVAVVTVDLPELPEGRVYQAWNVEDHATISLGVIPNHGAVAFEGDMSRMKAVAITVEPEGGSDVATTDPILVSTF